MFQIYSSASSAFRRSHNLNKSKLKNSTTTTGFISQSQLQTKSTDIQENTPLPRCKLKLTRNYNQNKTFNITKTEHKSKASFSSFNKTLTLSSQSNQPENTTKQYELRKLRMKLHKLINLKKSNLCSQFDCKNDIFNRKVNDYFQSERYINRNINYHQTFHFNQHSLGEAHDKYSMIIDLNSDKEYIKKQQKLIKKEFNKNFTEQEKKKIILDPDYFISNKKTCSKLGIFKNMNLLERLNEEENSHNKKMLNNTTQKSKRNKKRFDQMLGEIQQLKENYLVNLEQDTNFNTPESRTATLLGKNNVKPRSTSLNLTLNSNKHKSIIERKRKLFTKKTALSIETENLIKKAVNQDHTNRIKEYLKSLKKKDKVEKELRDLQNKIQMLGNKKYIGIPIIKEHNLTENCKLQYSIMLNKKQLDKIDKFIENEKHQEDREYCQQIENEHISKYITKVREQYIKEHINK